MTYSMCCQRATMVVRLPTLTLPATAPTVGSANGWTRRWIASGSTTVSPSTMITIGWVDRAIPALRAAAFPPHGTRTTRTPGRFNAATTAAVPSVDASSTTTTSTSWQLVTRDVTVPAMPSRSFQAGTITETGSVTGGPHDQAGDRRRRAWPIA